MFWGENECWSLSFYGSDTISSELIKPTSINSTSLSLAMQKKVVVNEVRTPTNTWSGLGFSKSMPESAIKELVSQKYFNLKNIWTNKLVRKSFRPNKNTVRTFYCQNIFDYVYLGKCANYWNCKNFTTRKAYENAGQCNSIRKDNKFKDMLKFWNLLGKALVFMHSSLCFVLFSLKVCRVVCCV